jgi:hypothetical protein
LPEIFSLLQLQSDFDEIHSLEWAFVKLRERAHAADVTRVLYTKFFKGVVSFSPFVLE